jgi:hypothetical protein
MGAGFTPCPLFAGVNMTKIVCTDGTEEYLSPGAARAKVAKGEAVFAQTVPMYTTRQMVAEPVKAKRKRRSKAEMQADADETD